MRIKYMIYDPPRYFTIFYHVLLSTFLTNVDEKKGEFVF